MNTHRDRPDGPDITSFRYRVSQFEWDPINKGHNESVSDFEDLVIHHPESNRNAAIRDGIVANAEAGRAHAFIGGELQEIEFSRPTGTYGLSEHQVLLKKDFLLEDSRIPIGAAGVRDVDVPSPVHGYVGRVIPSAGLVDIYDRPGGYVVARIRHMNPIHVHEGNIIEYGQALGVQNRQGLKPTAGKHVHLEMDTRYYQQYENYISDLVNGRLTIDTDRRSHGIIALPILDDGTFRLGETNPRIREFQEVLISQGYRGARDKPLQADGIYRFEMQRAVLDFQRDHGLAQTGDIDRSTLHIALPSSRGIPIDRMDHLERTRMPFEPELRLDAPIQEYRPGPHDYRRHPPQPEPVTRTGRDLLAYCDARHPDHALHEAIRKQLPPNVSEEMAAHITLQAKIGGVDSVIEFKHVTLHNGHAFVMGRTPGDDAKVNLSASPPSLEDTMRQSVAFDQQQAIDLARAMEQVRAINERGPAMELRGPGGGSWS